MAVTVAHGSDPRELRGFLDLPVAVTSRDPDAPRVNTRKVAAQIATLAQSGEQRLFLARNNGRPVARLMARSSPAHLDEAGRPLGMIGFFDSFHDLDATSALFDSAEDYLRSLGCRQIVGPIDGDTWHRYRLNIGPYHAQPFLLETYNPRFYPTLWDHSRYEELEGYSSKRIDDITPLLPALREKHDAAIGRGYRFESFALVNFKQELERVHALSVEIFKDNFLYSPIDLETFIQLYDGAERMLEPELSWFLIAPDGSDAGFIFSYPDRFRWVQWLQRRSPISKLRGLINWNTVSAVNYKTLGVLPAHRSGGTGSGLLYRAYKASHERGWKIANHCLMRDDNVSQRMDSGQGTVFRRYVLYSKALS